MDIEEIRGHGHHLAMAAAIRMLAAHMAQIADPKHAEQWFTMLGQRTFDYVDRTNHPGFDEPTMREIKEATYDTLRMIFDPKGVEI
ncbi:MAG TPA: hypothetical protein VN769_01025 [Xanthobacteraceae bacterium]|nr:hypothetical protein [Xanthobacteraceae bacterium]